MAKCIEHDISFSRKVLGPLLRTIRNPITRRMALDFLEVGIRVVWSVKDRLLSDPLGLLEEASHLDVFNAGPRLFFSLIRSLLHARMALAHL